MAQRNVELTGRLIKILCMRKMSFKNTFDQRICVTEWFYYKNTNEKIEEEIQI